MGWSLGGVAREISFNKLKEKIKCLSTRGLLVGKNFYKELSNLNLYNIIMRKSIEEMY